MLHQFWVFDNLGRDQTKQKFPLALSIKTGFAEQVNNIDEI